MNLLKTPIPSRGIGASFLYQVKSRVVKPAIDNGRVVYNEIKVLVRKGSCCMDIDTILEKQIGCGGDLKLIGTATDAVSLVTEAPFYVKPTFNSVGREFQLDSKVISFSVPETTGRSALAKYISYKKKALLWDLSKERIANHSLTGMLVDSIGIDAFSRFTGGLKDGTSVLVVDALDEAEIFSGRVALETLLVDIHRYVHDAKSANVILCARTETARYIRDFFAREKYGFMVSHYGVGDFREIPLRFSTACGAGEILCHQ